MRRKLFLFIIFIAFFVLLPRRNVVLAAIGKNYVDDDFAPALKDAITHNSMNSVGYRAHGMSADVNNVTRLILGPVKCITVACNESDTNYLLYLQQNSAIVGLANGITMTFVSPPANTMAFVNDAAQSLGFAPKSAYAQGIGFSGLAPLLKIWKVFRNIAYLLLAVFMIIIGFMVMLRKKIDPKTVLTVQNSLPKIIMALLLITFSYAIVGLAVDLMYLAIFLTISLFKSTGLLPNPGGLIGAFHPTSQSLYTDGSTYANVFNFDFSPGKLLFGQQWDTTQSLVAGSVIGAIGAIAGAVLSGGNASAALVGALPGISIGLLALLISLAQLFLFIRLFFLFLSTYIKIVVSLISAPIHLLIEALPGTNAFSNWIKGLISNIIVFPIAAFLFMLANVFTHIAGSSVPIWSPPYAGLLVNNSASISAWVALGILFAIPSVVGSVQELLKAKPLISAGPEGLIGAVSQPASMAWQLGSFFMSHNQMKDMNAKLSKQGGSPPAQTNTS